jgi:hypothetical protein
MLSSSAHFVDTLKLGMKQGLEDQTMAWRQVEFRDNSIIPAFLWRFQSVELLRMKPSNGYQCWALLYFLEELSVPLMIKIIWNWSWFWFPVFTMWMTWSWVYEFHSLGSDSTLTKNTKTFKKKNQSEFLNKNKNSQCTHVCYDIVIWIS